MKTPLFFGLLAVSLGALGCAGNPDVDPNGDPRAAGDGETVAEAEQELTQHSSMGGLGWGSTAGPSSDLMFLHEISNVAGKWATVDMTGDFPNLEGVPATQANLGKCASAYVEMLVSTRSTASSSWTQARRVKQFAKSTVSGGLITDCKAAFEMADCDAIRFMPQTNLMRVEVLSFGGQSYQQPKTDTVRFDIINFPSCN